LNCVQRNLVISRHKKIDETRAEKLAAIVLRANNPTSMTLSAKQISRINA